MHYANINRFCLVYLIYYRLGHWKFYALILTNILRNAAILIVLLYLAYAQGKTSKNKLLDVDKELLCCANLKIIFELLRQITLNITISYDHHLHLTAKKPRVLNHSARLILMKYE